MTTVSKTQPLAVAEDQVSNGAEELIEFSVPYRLLVGLIGTSDLLFHAWNVASVAEKAASSKGSKAKKTDDVESYVYRDADGNLGVSGACLAAAIAYAGKSMPDPRSPRKSAYDLCRAGVIALDAVAPFLPLTKTWDYEDARRVTVQRNGITRIRPAMRTGWHAEFTLLITASEYLPRPVMTKLITRAGMFNGLCDFRPTFGRFAIERLEVLED